MCMVNVEHCKAARNQGWHEIYLRVYTQDINVHSRLFPLKKHEFHECEGMSATKQQQVNQNRRSRGRLRRDGSVWRYRLNENRSARSISTKTFGGRSSKEFPGGRPRLRAAMTRSKILPQGLQATWAGFPGPATSVNILGPDSLKANQPNSVGFLFIRT